MSGWRRELGRVAVILIGSSSLGFLANVLAAHPVSLQPSESADRAPRISAEELKEAWVRRKAVLLLDVRSEASYREGHASQAIHAPASEFLDRYRALGLANVLRAADGVVVACEGEDCSAGDHVAMLLKNLGHPEVRVLEGGWPAGRRVGLESMPR